MKNPPSLATGDPTPPGMRPAGNPIDKGLRGPGMGRLGSSAI